MRENSESGVSVHMPDGLLDEERARELTLADALTARTRKLCERLEDGTADIFDLVTPTTAELLYWWFGRAPVAARGQLNFHRRQRQAILNTIVAQEVLAAASLHDLYLQVLPEALDPAGRNAALSEHGHGHPRYGLKMTNHMDRTWVMHALMIWQMLNRSASFAAGWTDARFMQNFLVAAPGPSAYQRLLNVFFGQTHGGVRNFSTTVVAQFADMFVPISQRECVFEFMHTNTRAHEDMADFSGNGLIAICNSHLCVTGPEQETESAMEVPGLPLPGPAVMSHAPQIYSDIGLRHAIFDATLSHLAVLPDLMVFNEADPGQGKAHLPDAGEERWNQSLSMLASRKGRHFVQLDFSAATSVASDADAQGKNMPHLITT